MPGIPCRVLFYTLVEIKCIESEFVGMNDCFIYFVILKYFVKIIYLKNLSVSYRVNLESEVIIVYFICTFSIIKGERYEKDYSVCRYCGFGNDGLL